MEQQVRLILKEPYYYGYDHKRNCQYYSNVGVVMARRMGAIGEAITLDKLWPIFGVGGLTTEEILRNNFMGKLFRITADEFGGVCGVEI